MKVLVLHTLPPACLTDGRRTVEFDLSEAALGVAEALPGAVVAGVRGEAQEILTLLAINQPDVVFNLCEAPLGRPELEPHVAALLEWLNVRFTGSGSETLALCRRKDRLNAMLEAAGVPVPRQNIFPCVVKPADEDGSAGIFNDSVCEDETDVARARARIAGPVIVQEFLTGREFVISLWGGGEPTFASVGETRFNAGLRLLNYDAKWDYESADYKNSPLFYETEREPELHTALVDIARRVWQLVGARGYIRMDLRLNSAGVPCVLDVNPNPEITPDVGIHRAVTEVGWTWEQFVRQQVEWALTFESFSQAIAT